MASVIGVFDSGVGGLKILQGMRGSVKNTNFFYVFDRSGAPYGNKNEKTILKRACQITEMLIEKKASIVVIACNTATAIAIDHLRKNYPVEFVGVEPPVVPALKVGGAGKVLLLCTPLTAKTKRLQRLCAIRDDIIVAPQKDLATRVEQEFLTPARLDKDVEKMLNRYGDTKIKAVALGCTHYYYIKEKIEKYYGYSVPVFTAVDGVVNRVKSLKKEDDTIGPGGLVKYIYL